MIRFITSSSSSLQSCSSLTVVNEDSAQAVPSFRQPKQLSNIQRNQDCLAKVPKDHCSTSKQDIDQYGLLPRASVYDSNRPAPENKQTEKHTPTVAYYNTEIEGTKSFNNFPQEYSKPQSYYPSTIGGDVDIVDMLERKSECSLHVVEHEEVESDKRSEEKSKSKKKIRRSSTKKPTHISGQTDAKFSVKLSWGSRTNKQSSENHMSRASPNDGRLYRIDTIVDLEEVLAKSTILDQYIAQKKEEELLRLQSKKPPTWIQLSMLNFDSQRVCNPDSRPSSIRF